MDPQLPVVAGAVALPFIAAAVTPLVHRLLDERVGYFGAIVAAVSFGLIASQLGREGTVSLSWIPSLNVAMRFNVDGLALLFALLASGIGVLIFTYASSYMHGKPNLGRFYMTLLAFMGSILGVAFAADLIALFLFWELTSVCSFVLIGYHTEDDESRYSARMAMLITVGGGLCLLFAVVLLSVAATTAFGLGDQTFDLAAILAGDESVRVALEESGLLVPVIGLVAIAAGAKSAQVPFHFWLPRAMVAPTPVSAFLHSATMVKVGVYAIGRLRPIFNGEEWMLVFATLGLVTMTVGAVLAVVATDIKELLAYSTASHLGLMIAGFGFQSHYGAEVGAFHLLNHALFKAALFLVAGIVAHEVGTRHLDKLGGLRHDLPITAAITVIAALSMAGIPPFSGFYSKEILFAAAYHAAEEGGGLAWLYPSVAVFASIFTVLYSLRFLAMFFGDKPDTVESVHRPSLGLIAPPAVLAGLTAVISVAPDLAIDAIVDDAASATARETIHVHAAIPTELSGPVVMSIITVGVGAALFPVYGPLANETGRIKAALAPAHPTALYNQLLSATETASTRLGPLVHNGLIRTYVTWALAAACTFALLGYATTATSIPAITGIATPVAMILVLAVAIVAAIAVTVSPSHVAGVLTLGILGFMVAIFYILTSGPDLALTQLVVETLLLLIFLLVIEELPAYYGELDASVAVRDVALSLVVGVTAFVSVLLASPGSNAALTDTADYYINHAVKEGGGANIVNVILTDFRAFDTLGESVVILIAALSILVLLTMRNRGETR